MTIPPPYDADRYQDAAGALREMLRWVGEPLANDRRHPIRTFRNRAVALLWVVNPDAVGGLSARALARRMGMRASTLTVFTAQVRDRFGIRNRFSAHDWRRR
jgi:hypothetical protein